MTVGEEPPLPAAGPWAQPGALRLGVVGTRGLLPRLGRMLPVVPVLPRNDPAEVCREVDALVLELSAFEDATSSWAHALRPVGFDRGTALAALLRAARSAQVPVLGVDDRSRESRDSWQGMLARSLDDVAPLGPVIDGGLTWNPGLHWSSDLLGVVAGGGTEKAAVGASLLWPTGDDAWLVAQRMAATTGTAVVDLDDPWERHLADELALFGVAVRACTGGPVLQPTHDLLPGAALAQLCRRLGLGEPEVPHVLVAHEPPTDESSAALHDTLGEGHEVVAPDAALARAMADPEVVVLAADPDRPVDPVAARTCRDALDRAPDVVVVAARRATVVGARGHLVASLVRSEPVGGPGLHQLLQPLAAPHEVA